MKSRELPSRIQGAGPTSAQGDVSRAEGERCVPKRLSRSFLYNLGLRIVIGIVANCFGPATVAHRSSSATSVSMALQP